MSSGSIEKGWKLTVKERILVALWDHYPPSDSFEKDFALTQQGIADSVGVRRSAIPRAMKALTGREVVRSELCHVTGVKRRRKCYFLTSKGYGETKKMIEQLRGVEVEVIEKDGESKSEKTLGDVLEETRGFGMIDLLRAFREEGRIDISKVKRGERVREESGKGPGKKKGKEGEKEEKERTTGDYVPRVPGIGQFFGRRKELEALDRAFGEGYKFVFIYGIAGIGKTTLAANYVRRASDLKKVFWHKFHTWDDKRTLLSEFAVFLKHLGLPDLLRRVKKEKERSFRQLSNTLLRELDRVEAIFVFDDFDLAPDVIVEFTGMLKEAGGRIENAGFLIVSRKLRKFYDVRDTLLGKKVYELELRGLDENSVEKLYRAEREKGLLKGEGDPVPSSLMKISKGHPLAVKILARREEADKGVKERFDIKRFLEEEIFQKLAPDERFLLHQLAVAGKPVDVEAVFFDKILKRRNGEVRWVFSEDGRGYDWSTLDTLLLKNLVIREDNRISVHDLVKEFFSREAPPSKKRRNHMRIASYLFGRLRDTVRNIRERRSLRQTPATLTPDEEEDVLSFLYHLTGSGSLELLPVLVNDLRTVFPFIYRQKEIIGMIGKLDRSGLLPREKRRILSFLGEMYSGTGEVEKAIAHYYRSLVVWLRNSGEDVSISADIEHSLKSSGNIPTREVIGVIEKATERIRGRSGASSNNDPDSLLADILRLGLVYLRAEDLDRADEILKYGATAAEDLGSRRVLADFLAACGWVRFQLGEVNRAKEYYTECLGELAECKGVPGAIRKNIAEGQKRARDGDLEGAFVRFNRCMSYFEKGGGTPGTGGVGGIGDHYLRTLLTIYLERPG